MATTVKNLAAEVNAQLPRMRETDGRLVAQRAGSPRCVGGPNSSRARVHSPEGRGTACKTDQRPAQNERTKVRPIPEAADVTEADRVQCRTLIEATGFHAVDYEEDGAVWERMLPGGECLVLAVRESALFGKPERQEWTLVKFMKDGTPDGFAGPVTLHDALSLAIAFPVLPRSSMVRP